MFRKARKLWQLSPVLKGMQAEENEHIGDYSRKARAVQTLFQS